MTGEEIQKKFWKGVWKNDGDQIMQAVRSGADLEEKDEYDLSPLASAAREGLFVSVSILLKLGASPSCPSGFWEATPLHFASLNGHLSVAKVLVAAGADINARNKNGETPLTWAKERGHLNVMSYLSSIGGRK